MKTQRTNPSLILALLAVVVLIGLLLVILRPEARREQAHKAERPSIKVTDSSFPKSEAAPESSTPLTPVTTPQPATGTDSESENAETQPAGDGAITIVLIDRETMEPYRRFRICLEAVVGETCHPVWASDSTGAVFQGIERQDYRVMHLDQQIGSVGPDDLNGSTMVFEVDTVAVHHVRIVDRDGSPLKKAKVLVDNRRVPPGEEFPCFREAPWRRTIQYVATTDESGTLKLRSFPGDTRFDIYPYDPMLFRIESNRGLCWEDHIVLELPTLHTTSQTIVARKDVVRAVARVEGHDALREEERFRIAAKPSYFFGAPDSDGSKPGEKSVVTEINEGVLYLLPSTSYVVTVHFTSRKRKPPYIDPIGSLEVYTDQEPREMEFVISPSKIRTINGRIAFDDGFPVEGVEVMANNTDESVEVMDGILRRGVSRHSVSSLSDSTGSFVIKLAESGGYSFSIRKGMVYYSIRREIGGMVQYYSLRNDGSRWGAQGNLIMYSSEDDQVSYAWSDLNPEEMLTMVVHALPRFRGVVLDSNGNRRENASVRALGRMFHAVSTVQSNNVGEFDLPVDRSIREDDSVYLVAYTAGEFGYSLVPSQSRHPATIRMQPTVSARVEFPLGSFWSVQNIEFMFPDMYSGLNTVRGSDGTYLGVRWEPNSDGTLTFSGVPQDQLRVTFREQTIEPNTYRSQYSPIERELRITGPGRFVLPTPTPSATPQP